MSIIVLAACLMSFTVLASCLMFFTVLASCLMSFIVLAACLTFIIVLTACLMSFTVLASCLTCVLVLPKPAVRGGILKQPISHLSTMRPSNSAKTRTHPDSVWLLTSRSYNWTHRLANFFKYGTPKHNAGGFLTGKNNNQIYYC